MDAATVDFKGGGDTEFYNKIMNVRDPELIYETLIAMKDKGWWVEVTNLVIPKYGDNPENIRRMARWIADNLNPETPFHLLRLRGAHR
jgi:pyruvate formate lyase activating enzyme